jgi:hypothetical protein
MTPANRGSARRLRRSPRDRPRRRSIRRPEANDPGRSQSCNVSASSSRPSPRRPSPSSTLSSPAASTPRSSGSPSLRRGTRSPPRPARKPRPEGATPRAYWPPQRHAGDSCSRRGRLVRRRCARGPAARAGNAREEAEPVVCDPRRRRRLGVLTVAGSSKYATRCIFAAAFRPLPHRSRNAVMRHHGSVTRSLRARLEFDGAGRVAGSEQETVPGRARVRSVLVRRPL